MGASLRRWPNWPVVKSSTESVIITPEPHRGKGRERERVGEDTEVPKQKPPLSVLFSLCLLRGKKDRKILALRKGIIGAVMTADGKVEQDLKQITRVYCSCGSHSDMFADTSIRCTL